MKWFIFLYCSALFAKTVYITPIGGLDKDKLFFDPHGYRDECAKPFFVLRETLEKAGYTVKYTMGRELAAEDPQDVAAILVITHDDPYLLEQLKRFPKKSFLMLFESPLVMPHMYRDDLGDAFTKVFTLAHNMVDGKRFFPFYYVQPRMEMLQNIPDFSQKKFCALIAGHKDSENPLSLYPERINVIRFFGIRQIQGFDLYGSGWEGMPNWRGTIESKWEVLKNYRYSFCYENLRDCPGYITEKIFDSMIAGCVPIYWGASNITDFVPKECFIDRRDFGDTSDLYRFLRMMKKKDYDRYIAAIRNYFATNPQAKLFTIEHFVNTFLHEIRQCESL